MEDGEVLFCFVQVEGNAHQVKLQEVKFLLSINKWPSGRSSLTVSPVI